MTARAAIFDGGGVLTTSVTDCFSAFERALGVAEVSLLSALRHPTGTAEPLFYDLERGRLSEEEFWRRLPTEVESRLGMRLELPSDVEEIRRMLWGSIRANDRMHAVVRAVRRRYLTALLTNGVREWVELRALFQPEQFHVVVDSCEVGLRKPELEIYRLVCSQLGVDPEGTVFIDDVPEHVEAARSLGMIGIVFEDTDSAIAELARHFPRALAEVDP